MAGPIHHSYNILWSCKIYTMVLTSEWSDTYLLMLLWAPSDYRKQINNKQTIKHWSFVEHCPRVLCSHRIIALVHYAEMMSVGGLQYTITILHYTVLRTTARSIAKTCHTMTCISLRGETYYSLIELWSHMHVCIMNAFSQYHMSMCIIIAYHDIQEWSGYTGEGRKKGGIETMSEEVCLQH